MESKKLERVTKLITGKNLNDFADIASAVRSILITSAEICKSDRKRIGERRKICATSFVHSCEVQALTMNLDGKGMDVIDILTQEKEIANVFEDMARVICLSEVLKTLGIHDMEQESSRLPMNDMQARGLLFYKI